MGDTYQKLVPAHVDKTEVDHIQTVILSFLTQRQIISPDPIDNVMDSEAGYPPGPRYKDAIYADPSPGLLKQTTNGVEISRGRNVFFADEPKSVNCPNCGHNMVRKKWAKAIDAWYQQKGKGHDELTCTQCGQPSSITSYEFQPTWAFGEIGLTFWNWPPLRSDFLRELEKELGRSVRIVSGQY